MNKVLVTIGEALTKQYLEIRSSPLLDVSLSKAPSNGRKVDFGTNGVFVGDWGDSGLTCQFYYKVDTKRVFGTYRVAMDIFKHH